MFKGRDMETLLNVIRSPDENEQGLRLVWESVARVIKRCIEGVNDVEDRAWDLIPFWLNSSLLNEPDSKPNLYAGQNHLVILGFGQLEAL
jgi:hypothetical protein